MSHQQTVVRILQMSTEVTEPIKTIETVWTQLIDNAYQNALTSAINIHTNLVNQFNNIFTSITNRELWMINLVGEPLLQVIESNQNSIKWYGNMLVNAVAQGFNQVEYKIKAEVNNTIDALNQNVDRVNTWIENLSQGLIDHWNDNFLPLRNRVDTLENSFNQKVSDFMVSQAAVMETWIRGIADQVFQVQERTDSEIQQMITLNTQPIWTSIVSGNERLAVIEAVLASPRIQIDQGVTNVTNNITQDISATADQINTIIGPKLADLKAQIAAITEEDLLALAEILKVSGDLTAKINAIEASVSTQLAQSQTSINNIISAAETRLQSSIDGLTSTVDNKVKGLEDKLNKAVGDIQDAITDVINVEDNRFGQVLGFLSLPVSVLSTGLLQIMQGNTMFLDMFKTLLSVALRSVTPTEE